MWNSVDRTPSRIARFLLRTGCLAAAGLLLVASPPPAQAINQDVKTFHLANGLQVVVIPDRRAPVVTQMVWYKVGSADEPRGKSGIAHFLEHLMFKGTAKVPPGEFSRIIRRNGGEDNAFTATDYTGYFERIAKDRLGLVMELEADRMANLTLKDEDVLPERDVVLEERGSRTDNEPAGRLSEQLNAALYLAHPYGIPIIGWRHEIEKLSREDAIAFYRYYYTPKNAILIVAGDVTEEEVRALAEKHFGPLPNTGDPGPRLRAQEPEPQAARRVILKDPAVANPSLRRAYLARSYATAAAGEAEALDLLAEVLGGGATSRLYRKLVVGQKIASYAGAWYDGDGLDGGTIGVYGAPIAGQTIEAVEAGIDAAIEELIANGITEEELHDARNTLHAETVYALDSQSHLARIFGTALSTGTTVADVLDWPRRLDLVTREQVMAAARKYLKPEGSATGILLREGKPDTVPAAKAKNGERKS